MLPVERCFAQRARDVLDFRLHLLVLALVRQTLESAALRLRDGARNGANVKEWNSAARAADKGTRSLLSNLAPLAGCGR